MEAIPRIVSEILFDESASTRDRLRAAEVIASLVQSRVNAAVVLDKIERLDGGKPTERFVVPPDIQERVQAIRCKVICSRTHGSRIRTLIDDLDCNSPRSSKYEKHDLKFSMAVAWYFCAMKTPTKVEFKYK